MTAEKDFKQVLTSFLRLVDERAFSSTKEGQKLSSQSHEFILAKIFNFIQKSWKFRKTEEDKHTSLMLISDWIQMLKRQNKLALGLKLNREANLVELYFKKGELRLLKEVDKD